MVFFLNKYKLHFCGFGLLSSFFFYLIFKCRESQKYLKHFIDNLNTEVVNACV